MITFNFYKVSERMPKHGESIIYLKGVRDLCGFGFEPREINVVYYWNEIDENGL